MSRMELGVSGHFKLEVTRDGVKRTVAEFENLILNGGLDQLTVAANPLSYCRVGTGSAAPLPTDTVLGNQIGSTGTVQSQQTGTQTTAPYYGWRRVTMRFAPGTATGNISEVGIAPAASGQLFARALIKDAQGNPTTITILADETLDVTYELRIYPPTSDSVFNVTISGNVYQCTMRAASVTSTVWAPSTLTNIFFLNAAGYDGAIGAVTGTPGGASSVAATGTTNGTYTNGTYSRTFTLTFGLNAGNLAAGLRSMRLYFAVGEFQCEFSPVLPKDSTKVLTLNGSISWARRP